MSRKRNSITYSTTEFIEIMKSHHLTQWSEQQLSFIMHSCPNPNLGSDICTEAAVFTVCFYFQIFYLIVFSFYQYHT